MDSSSLLNVGDEMSITFKQRTFRAALVARLVQPWRKSHKAIVVRRLPSEIEETIPLNTVKEISLLNQA